MNLSTPTTPRADSRTPLDYEGAAAYLNTTARHMRRLVARREIPFVKVGRLVRFLPEALDEYLASRTIGRAS